VWRIKEPTWKQLYFLHEHGHKEPVATRGKAADLIAAVMQQE
jgi:hypothetical protein